MKRLYKDHCKFYQRGFTFCNYTMANGQERGACYGYTYKMTDEPLKECKSCLDFAPNTDEEFERSEK